MAIKKTWFDIVAPEMFGSKVVGQTLAAEPKQIIGRTVSVSLADIGEDPHKFYMKMIFRIVNVDGKAQTEFIGHDTTYERIYRMVQRMGRRVDAIQDCKTKDGYKVRVKTVLMIPRRVGSSTKTLVRKKMFEVVERFVSDVTLEEFVKSIIGDKLQMTVKNECKKLYPIAQVEVRKSEVMGKA